MTITTELAQRIAAIAGLKAGYKIGHADVSILQDVARELDAARQRIAELECSETQLIQERDNAEEALADMYEAATGNRPEWSSAFGFDDAVDAVAQLMEARTEQQPVAVHELFLRAKALMYCSGGMAIERSLNPIDAWLYDAEHVANSAPEAQPVTVKLPERHELQETSRNPYQSYMQMLPEAEGDWVRHDDVVEVLTLAGINVAEATGD